MRGINGLLGIPRISRNGNFYFPEELERADGLTVPLRWDHIKTNDGIIGEAKLKYDKTHMQLLYKARVNNPEIEKLLDNESFQVSLGMQPEYVQKICHAGTKKCYDAPVNGVIKEMSIVKVPGLPETTLNLEEKFREGALVSNDIVRFTECACKNDEPGIDEPQVPLVSTSCSCNEKNTSISKDESNLRMEKTPELIEAEIRAKVEKELADKAEKVRLETEAKTQKEKLDEAIKKNDELSARLEALTKDIDSKVNAEVTAKLEGYQKEIRENYVPKSQATSGGKWVEEHVDDHIKTLQEFVKSNDQGYAKLDIDLTGFMEAHTARVRSLVTEAVSTSGTIPGLTTENEIIIIPGGVSAKPIRQWCQFREIPQGEDTRRFYKIDIPAFGDITETVNTDITPATHTLTSIDVTANTPRGFRQVVKKTELEKYPAALLETIRETARLRAIQDEANIVLALAGSTANDFGANHFSASDGTAVTTTTLEDAAGNMDEDGVAVPKEYLETQEQETAPGQVVLCLHPKAFRTLRGATNIASYIQIGDPGISRLGRMEMYLGVELMVTTNLVTANNAYRNIMFVKGRAFALASARNLELEFFKDPNKQNVSIVASHRKGAAILDATAYCIVSSFKQ